MENTHIKNKRKSILLATHNDDETIFASYIIQIFKPLVVIVTDSYVQWQEGISPKQRIDETKKAMDVLGASTTFLHIRDTEIGLPATIHSLVNLLTSFKPCKLVFAPAIEGGNEQHDLIGQIADEVFGDKVKHYHAYTKNRIYPFGKFKVQATTQMKKNKLLALDCYQSQINRKKTRPYFTCEYKDEYYD